MIVWLASYPRSGNTLLRILVNNVFGRESHSIHGDGLDIAADQRLSEVVGHKNVSLNDLDSFRARESLVFIKTHHRPDNRISSNDKVIYIIRDGRDSIVSYFHYIRHYVNKEIRMEDVICGNVIFGGWAEHISSWKPMNRERCLLLRFEEIIKSVDKSAARISNFIGILPISDSIPGFSELQALSPEFFRRGKIGGWADELDHLRHALFWLVNGDMMLQSNYRDQIPEVRVGGFNVPMEIGQLIRHELHIIGNRSSEVTKKKKRNRIRRLFGVVTSILGVSQEKTKIS